MTIRTRKIAVFLSAASLVGATGLGVAQGASSSSTGTGAAAKHRGPGGPGHRPLTSAQKTQTEKSWTTFFRETATHAAVKSWTLVCPCNPSNEALEWLEALTSEAQFPTDWMGRATLEAMAAENPALVEFYFGDGGERLHRAITNAFHGGRDVPEGVASEDLLEAITSRMLAL